MYSSDVPLRMVVGGGDGRTSLQVQWGWGFSLLSDRGRCELWDRKIGASTKHWPFFIGRWTLFRINYATNNAPVFRAWLCAVTRGHNIIFPTDKRRSCQTFKTVLLDACQTQVTWWWRSCLQRTGQLHTVLVLLRRYKLLRWSFII